MESLMQAQKRLEDYEAVMDVKRQANRQSRKERNLFKKDKVRVEARNRSVEENQQLAEARKARRILRAALSKTVAEVRRGAEVLGLGYTVTTTPEGRLYRVKEKVDPAILEARKAKTAAFHDKRDRSNFIKEIERAFEIAQERIDDPSVDPWFLPKADKAKPGWFPIQARVLHLEGGQRKALNFENLPEYANYRRSTRGFPETEAMRIDAEQQAARDRAEQRRRGAASAPREDDSEDEIIEPTTAEKGLAQEAYLKSRMKDRRREKTREDRDTNRHNKPKFMRNAKANLARSYKGQQGFVGMGKMKLAECSAYMSDAMAGNHGLTLRQVLDAALEGEEIARKIVAFPMKQAKQLVKRYDHIADLVVYTSVKTKYRRISGPKSRLTFAEAERRLRDAEIKAARVINEQVNGETKEEGELVESKDDNYFAPLDLGAPEVEPPGLVVEPTLVEPSRKYGGSDARTDAPSTKVDSPPTEPAVKPEKTRKGAPEKAKPKREGKPTTNQGDEGSKVEPLPEEALFPPFVPSASPNTRCLFRYDTEMHPDIHFAYDPMGAPFCGYVAVDLAAQGKAESLDFYRKWCTGRQLGTSSDIEKYARYRGFNLRIIDYVAPKTPAPVPKGSTVSNPKDWKAPAAWDVKWDGRPNPAHDTIFLGHCSGEGHYYLMAECVETNNNAALPQVQTRCRWERSVVKSCVVAAAAAAVITLMWYLHHRVGLPFNWRLFVPLLLAAVPAGIHWQPSVRFYDLFYNSNDRDRRLMLSRRDKLEVRASYCKAELTWDWYLWGISLCYTTVDLPRLISIMRFDEIYAQAQMVDAQGGDPNTCIDLVLQYRGDNTDPSLPGVFRSTGYVACKLAEYSDGTVSKGFQTDRNITYNANASFLVAAEAALARFSARVATVGYGNKIVKIKKKLTAIVGDVVATCALPVQTECGQLGCGWYPRTDGASVVAAFALRSMAGPEATVDRREFIEWSKSFMQRFIEEVNMSPHEPDEETLYRRVNKGKKSIKQVDRVLEEYRGYLAGSRKKKFSRHSAFVKFENSGKKEDRYGVKPRLIMTMSDLMAVQCSGVIEMIHAFNKTSFKRFQVKEMTPEEMVNRIADASGRPHAVSDYSSFEASIDETIREIENHVMMSTLRRAGWYRTAEAVEHFARKRILKTSEATFQISTRCSGDYWTSFGNGIVNVCIMAYCAHKAGEDPYNMNMIAEGDDGLVASHIPNKEIVTSLGFKYSVELAGNRPGDVDFLRSRWVDGKRYLDIGRCFSATWLKNGHRLSKEKQAFLVRCVANSLYHLSPGHPVVSALVWRLRKDHPKWKSFRGYLKYLDVYSATGHKIFEEPRDYKFFVHEEMRGPIAAGAQGFPPVSLASQYELERTIMFDKVPYIGSRLREYGDFQLMATSTVLFSPWVGDDTVLRSLLRVVGSEPEYVQAKGVAVSLA